MWSNRIHDAAGNSVANIASHIANINPFRYRSYYYDAEIAKYYLQSRYYDAAVGRPITVNSKDDREAWFWIVWLMFPYLEFLMNYNTKSFLPIPRVIPFRKL